MRDIWTACNEGASCSRLMLRHRDAWNSETLKVREDSEIPETTQKGPISYVRDWLSFEEIPSLR